MKIVTVLYPGGDAADNPELLGYAENALGLRDFVEENGHELVSITDREGDELRGHLQDAEVLITTPFWPVYVDEAMLDGAPELKLILTAGVGSDHVDLGAAAERNITVAEQTDSNTVSVAEHAVMQILALVRNYIPAYNGVVDGGWSIGEIAARSHDLEHKTVGIYGAGRIGQLISLRLKPFDVETLYCKRTRLETTEESTLGFRYARPEEMLEKCDDSHRLPPDTGDARPLRPREHLEDEAGLVHRQHSARRDHGDRRRGRGAGERSTRRLRRGRVGPAARSRGPSVAHHAPPRHDAARLRDHARRAAALRRGRQALPQSVLRGRADGEGSPDRPGR